MVESSTDMGDSKMQPLSANLGGFSIRLEVCSALVNTFFHQMAALEIGR